MMQVIDKGSIKMLVLNEGDEVIITSSTHKNSYTSVYHNGDNLVFDSTINSKNYMIPYKEREEIGKQKALKVKEQKHNSYLKNKAKKG